jgi:hypothetical protein
MFLVGKHRRRASRVPKRIVGLVAVAAFVLGIAGCAGGRSATVPKPSPDRITRSCNVYMAHGRKVEATCTTGAGWDSNTPIIGFSQIDSISYDSGLFDSSFDYESFEHIYQAVGPGDDMYNGWGGSKWDAAAYGSEIAMTKQGPPTGKCNDSLKGVGDTVGLANVDGSTSQRLVADINTVFAYGGSKIVGGRKVFMSVTVIGWVYKDDAGAYWFQKDAAISWQFALTAALNIGKWVQVQAGLQGTPNVNDPYFIGGSPPAEAAHTVTGQCYSEGARFYPDGIS